MRTYLSWKEQAYGESLSTARTKLEALTVKVEDIIADLEALLREYKLDPTVRVILERIIANLKC